MIQTEISVFTLCLSQAVVFIGTSQSQPYETTQGPLGHIQTILLHIPALLLQCFCALRRNGQKNSNVLSFQSSGSKSNSWEPGCLRYEVTVAIHCKSSAALYHSFERIGCRSFCKTPVR